MDHRRNVERRRKCKVVLVLSAVLVIGALVIAIICASASSPVTASNSNSFTAKSTTSNSPITIASTSFRPRVVVPTIRPLPEHPEKLAPKTLLLQVGLKLNYTHIQCANLHPPTWKFTLNIEGIAINYTAESSKKIHATTAAAMLAARDLFGINYNLTIPPAPHPCFPNGTTLDNLDDSEDVSSTGSNEAVDSLQTL